jgi:uncharacterized protein
MRIGVISDTHGDKKRIQQVVERAGSVALWLHAGDYYQDAAYLAELTGTPVHAVTGNCDGRGVGTPDLFLTLEGKHLMLTHGHCYRVKDGLQDLVWWGKQYEADIVIFGHTHQSVIQYEDGLVLMNPGSTTSPRGRASASFGLLELIHGEVRPTIIFVNSL